MTPLIGIDLGGTKTEVAVIGGDGQFLFRQRRPTPRNDYKAVLNTIHALVKQALATTGMPSPAAIGCGIPGCVDPDTALVRGASTLVLSGKPFASDMAELLGCRIEVQNDANCLAVSEGMDGAGQGSRLVFAAILGTGCGGGIFFQGHAWQGMHAIAGEWGHNPLPWPNLDEVQAPSCWCGLSGCLETWISGTGFARDHAHVWGEQFTALQIIENMRRGDKNALQSFDHYLNRLGRALAQVVNLLDPDCIVLGGGMSNVDEIYPAIQAQMLRYTFSKTVRTPVRKALHGDSSGVRGAAWLSQ